MYTHLLATVRMLEAARHNNLYQQMQQQQHHYKFNFSLHLKYPITAWWCLITWVI